MYVIEHRLDESRHAIEDMVAQLQQNKIHLDIMANRKDDVSTTAAENAVEPSILEVANAEPTTAVRVNERTVSMFNSSTPLVNYRTPNKLARATSARQSVTSSKSRIGIPVKSLSQPSSARMGDK